EKVLFEASWAWIQDLFEYWKPKASINNAARAFIISHLWRIREEMNKESNSRKVLQKAFRRPITLLRSVLSFQKEHFFNIKLNPRTFDHSIDRGLLSLHINSVELTVHDVSGFVIPCDINTSMFFCARSNFF